MVCRNCGNEMRDDARFCPNCGALNAPGPDGGLPQGAAPCSPTATPAWEGPEGGGKKKKTALFAAAALAAAALIAVVAVFAGGIFSSGKGTVEKAIAKSVAAYASSQEKLDVPDMEQWQKDRTIRQHMALELRGINSSLVGMDLSALNGLGLRLDTDYNGPDRQLYAGLGAYWGEEDLLSFGMSALDSEMYLESNQFFGGTCYGLNTETLGADLAQMTGDDSVKDLSFNMFELVDMVMEKIDQEAMEEDFKQAGKALWEAAKVKKLGARTLDINGTEAKTTAYQVVIPEEAMDQYADALAAVLSSVNYYDLYSDLYQAMGMPQDQIDEIMSVLKELDFYGELADNLHRAVDELGDVELEVCLSGGYVSAVFYEDRVDGTDLSIDIRLGGGEMYVDDLSVNVEADDISIEVKSTGDHGLKSGVYTDETTARVRQDSATLARVTSDMSLDPGKSADNFQWKLGVDSSGLSIFVLEMEGDYQAEADLLSLSSENVSLRVMGVEVCTLAFDYYVDCHPNELGVSNPTLITQMSPQELEQAAMDIQERAMTWVVQMQQLFTARLPEDVLWAIMGGY